MPKNNPETALMQPRTALVQARYDRGWSQQMVADQIGTTPLNVSRWERGLTTPSPYFRHKLCTLFDMTSVNLGLSTDPESIRSISEETSVALPESIFDPALPVLPGTHLLVGRDQVLAQIRHHLSAMTTVARSALHGLPGVGKTTLALHLAYDHILRERFVDGVLWAGLGPSPDVQGILSRWGTLLGIGESESKQLADVHAWRVRLRATIGSRRMLLIIDDAWQLGAALACQVGGPACATLLTTRFPQIALSFAPQETVTVEELDEGQSLGLLTYLAPDVVQHEPEQVHMLVQVAGGLPLALTLMGNYLRGQSYSGQPRRIKAAITHLLDSTRRVYYSEPRPLTDEAPSRRGGIVSLQAVIAVSDQQLDGEGRAMLRALSVLPAKPTSFSEEVALTVSGGTAEALDALSDAGLLESAGPERYMLHQTIVDYGQLYLTDSAPQKRLIAYVVSYLQQYQTDFPMLERENVLLSSAVEVALSTDQQMEGIQGVIAFAPFLIARGLHETAEHLFIQASEVSAQLKHRREQIQLLSHLIQMNVRRGVYVQAEQHALQALPLAREEGEIEQICSILAHLVGMAATRGDLQAATNYAEEELTLARGIGVSISLCQALNTRGILEYSLGELNQAQATLLEAASMARILGVQTVLGTVFCNLGLVEHERGDYQQATLYLQEAIQITRGAEDFPKLAIALNSLGLVAKLQGHYEQALSYYQEGIVMARRMRDRDRLCDLLSNQGNIFLLQKRYTEALPIFQEALALARQMEDTLRICTINAAFGEIADGEGNYAQAEVYWQEAVSKGHQLRRPIELSSMLYTWGEHYLKQQCITQAADAFRQMQTYIPEGHRQLQGLFLYGSARVALAQQDPVEARSRGEESLALLESIKNHKVTEVKQWLAQTFPSAQRIE